MKKILFVLVAAAGFVACKTEDKKVKDSPVAPSGQQTTVVSDSSSLTSIQWLDSTYLNLGKIKDGATVEVSFRFRNTGSKPLVITNVSAGCGCTIPETPKEPYAPGAEGVIKASFNSKGRKGENNKEVFVDANVPSGRETLKFRVEVID
jgi:Protein of unknown function (DUF1573)